MTEHPDREKRSFTSVDEYIDAALMGVDERLVEMRRIIRAAAPGTEETISYNIPAYTSDGVVVVQFAGYAEHTSLNFFPTAGVYATFNDELAAYKTSKSAIRFPLDEPLPVDLIDAIVRFRVNEVADYVASRKR
ncbi:DUF1801 domain-containing protein [Aeromicrobium panaciterrae]|uniref:iron chaperone n=1 Tax=Aeromicrobium panaciterrae TaxID=363861 RepID=UPI0031CFDE9C